MGFRDSGDLTGGTSLKAGDQATGEGRRRERR